MRTCVANILPGSRDALNQVASNKTKQQLVIYSVIIVVFAFASSLPNAVKYAQMD